MDIDRQAEIRDFLKTRRARISPEEAGLPRYDGVRRVPGLRREEVAQAAAISVDYYNRLERGKVAHASPEVLTAIARTLHLDEAESDYLRSLFRTGASTPPARRSARRRPGIRPTLQRLVDDLTFPAFVETPRLEIIAANHAGRALYSWLEDDFRLPFSVPCFLFLDPRARDFYPDWDTMARNTVALLRAHSGAEPDDPELLTLIGRLATRSDAFRRLWAAHDVRRYRQGAKRFRHPAAGELEFFNESLDVGGTDGLCLLSYTIEPGSRTSEAMAWLGSWTATEEASAAADSPDAVGDQLEDRSRPRPR